MIDEKTPPDFYLASTEGYGLQIPRKCWRVRHVVTNTRDDLVLVRIHPPLIYQNLPVDEVVLAARHAGQSVSCKGEWPIAVHVAIPSGEAREDAARLQNEELTCIAWAELYPDELAARQ